MARFGTARMLVALGCLVVAAGCVAALIVLRSGRPLHYTDGERSVRADRLAHAPMQVLGAATPELELPGPVRGRVAALADGTRLFGRVRADGGTDLVRWDPASPEVAPLPLPLVDGAGHDFAPALDAAGDLWFASDRPGGAGGFDLWCARHLGDGRFDVPEPLGAPFNTTADEVDPAPDPRGGGAVFVRRHQSLAEGRNGRLIWAGEGRSTPLFDAVEPGADPRFAFLQPIVDRDPAFGPDGVALWFVRQRLGEDPVLHVTWRHRGAFTPAVAMPGPAAGRPVRGPAPRADGSLELVDSRGERPMLHRAAAGLVHPFWPGQEGLERGLWIALGVALTLLALVLLGARWRHADVITWFLLLSALLHLLVWLWLAGLPLLDGGGAADDGDERLAIRVVSRATGASAAGGADAPLAQQVDRPAVRAAREPRDAELAAIAPGTRLAAATPARRSGARAVPVAAVVAQAEAAPPVARLADAATAVVAPAVAGGLEAVAVDTAPAPLDLPRRPAVAAATRGERPEAVGLTVAAPIAGDALARPDGSRRSAPGVVARPSTPVVAASGPRPAAPPLDDAAGAADVAPDTAPMAVGPLAATSAPAALERADRGLPAARPLAAPDAAGSLATRAPRTALATPSRRPPVATPQRRASIDVAGRDPGSPSATAPAGPTFADALPPRPAVAADADTAADAADAGGAVAERATLPELTAVADAIPGPDRAAAGEPERAGDLVVAAPDRGGLPTAPRRVAAAVRPAPTRLGPLAAAPAPELRDPSAATAGAAERPAEVAAGRRTAAVGALVPLVQGTAPLAAPTPEGRAASRIAAAITPPPSSLPRAPRAATALRGERAALLAGDGLYANRFGPAKAAALDRFGGSVATESAVARGLAYLAGRQRPDGLWGSRRDRDRKYGEVVVGRSALCLLAFLGAGHVPGGVGEHAAVVDRAVDALLATQDPDTGHFGRTSSYSHGITTYALAEAYAMTRDRRLRAPLERAVSWILRQQDRGRDPRNRGGWGYFSASLRPEDGFARTSVTAWMVMALESARLGGFDVPEDARREAGDFLRRMFDARRGYYLYNREPGRLRSSWRTLPASTPAAVFCLLLTGTDRDADGIAGALDFIVERRPRRYREASTDDFVRQAAGNVYFWYYGSLACFVAGGEAWTTWNAALKETLLPAQRADGGWDPIGAYADYADDTAEDACYTTATLVLSLEVYYRYFTPLLTVR